MIGYVTGQEVIECATNVVFAIVYGVTGHRTQMAIYAGLATLCLIDILVELGVPGKIKARGQLRLMWM